MGQRTRKTLYQQDGITLQSTTIYHYDQMGMLVTETTATGTLIKDYIWNGGMPAAQIDATTTGSTTTESIIYLYTDHLMTNRLATNQTQAIVWHWEGDAFGNTPANELAGISVNLRFPGQYYDQETNLHYNWNRYYDPSIGRYITSDPIGIDGGMNTYNYAMQNPIQLIDTTGLLTIINCKDEELIKREIGRAVAAAETCLDCPDKELFLEKIKSIVITCTNIITAYGRPICGMNNGESKIAIGPRDPGERFQCPSCFASTIFHEITHLIGYSEDEAEATQLKCISCD